MLCEGHFNPKSLHSCLVSTEILEDIAQDVLMTAEFPEDDAMQDITH